MKSAQQRMAAHCERKQAAKRKEAAKFKDGDGYKRAKMSRERAAANRKAA